jgi:hypothetical protein
MGMYAAFYFLYLTLFMRLACFHFFEVLSIKPELVIRSIYTCQKLIAFALTFLHFQMLNLIWFKSTYLPFHFKLTGHI